MNENTTLLPTIESNIVSLRDIEIERFTDEKGRGFFATSVSGQRFESSQRFMDSTFSLIGQGRSVLNLFKMEEVVERFLNSKPDTNVRVTTVGDKLLAVSRPNSPIVTVDNVLKAAGSRMNRISYHDGVLLMETDPNMKEVTSVLNDRLINKSYFEIPVDGYGNPKHFVGFLRQVCKNGMIGYAKAFGTSLNFGKDENPNKFNSVLGRFIQNVADAEAQTSLLERIKTASVTPASLNEVLSLARIADRYNAIPIVESVMNRAMEDTEIDLSYAEAKEMRSVVSGRVATRISVYDLWNMASEAATHYNLPQALASIGTQASGTFDLENAATHTADTNKAFWLN